MTNQNIISNKAILKRSGKDNEYALFPLKYQWTWDFYKKMIANLWTPEEIGLAQDVSQWRSQALSDEEQHLYLTVFAQVTTFDLLRTADIVKEFLPLVQAPEIIHCLTTQAFQEALHTHSYQFIIETLGFDQEDIYTRYRRFPELSNRVALTEKLGGLTEQSTLEDILRGLVHTYIVFEGCWFMMNLLGPIQSLSRRGYMRGTAEQFQYIARDENVHVYIGIELIKSFIQEYPGLLTESLIKSIIEDTEEGLSLEDDFIDYALPSPIMGYNVLDHKLTARHYAQRWLARIGIRHDFGGEHKMPWVDELIALKKEKNFFETRVTDYQLGQGLDWGEGDPESGFDSVL